MRNELNKIPVPNHTHGRITDINTRLKSVRNQLSRILDRLRPSVEDGGEESGHEISHISHSVQNKLSDTSALVHDIELLAEEYEQVVGTADEDVPMKGATRAIG